MRKRAKTRHPTAMPMRPPIESDECLCEVALSKTIGLVMLMTVLLKRLPCRPRRRSPVGLCSQAASRAITTGFSVSTELSSVVFSLTVCQIGLII